MRLPTGLTILLYLLLVLVPSVVALRVEGNLQAIVVAILPTWALIALRTFYENSDWCYFWVNRAMMWILNLDVHWDLEAEWSEYDGLAPVLGQIVEDVRDTVPQAVLRQDDIGQKILECPGSGYTILVVEQADAFADVVASDGQNVVRLRVSEMIVPFRFADKLIDRELLPMLSAIQRHLAAHQEKYSIKVTFFGDNPYFGLYLRRLRLREILHFSCEFVDKKAPGNVVSVKPDSVTIASRDLVSIGALAKKYLALSPPS